MSKKKSKKQNHAEEKTNINLDKELKETHSEGVVLINDILTCNIRESIESHGFVSFSTENIKNINFLNEENVINLYKDMAFNPNFLNLYLENAGKFRYTLLRLMSELHETRFEEPEKELANNKKIIEILHLILDTIDNITVDYDSEITDKNIDEIYRKLQNILVTETKKRNLYQHLTFSCEDIFLLPTYKKYMYICNFVTDIYEYSEYIKILKRKEHIYIQEPPAIESIKKIYYLLVTPQDSLITGKSKYNSCASYEECNIYILQNINFNIWKNDTYPKPSYFFDGAYGRFRYCLEILIKKITKYYSSIEAEKIDKILGMHQKIFNMLTTLMFNIEQRREFREISGMEQLSMYLCCEMIDCGFFDDVCFIDFCWWCKSPYVEWEYILE